MAGPLRISVQEFIPEFVQLSKRGKGNLVMSHTILAVEKLSTMYEETWKRATLGASFPGLPFEIHSTNYQRTIQRRQLTPTSWEIFSDHTTKTGLGITSLLERGHGPIDLKPGLLTGPKSRQGKEGRYNIVSFRQGTPGTDQFRNNPMPLSVYRSFTQQVKALDAKRQAGASKVSGTSYTSQSSAKPGDRSYAWGAKYDAQNQRGRRSKLITKKGKRIGSSTWKTGKYAGMVRLQQSTAKSNRGGYFTFRVVSYMSDPMSWIVPEKPPWPVRRAVIDVMRPFAEGMLQEALEADII